METGMDQFLFARLTDKVFSTIASTTNTVPIEEDQVKIPGKMRAWRMNVIADEKSWNTNAAEGAMCWMALMAVMPHPTWQREEVIAHTRSALVQLPKTLKIRNLFCVCLNCAPPL